MPDDPLRRWHGRDARGSHGRLAHASQAQPGSACDRDHGQDARATPEASPLAAAVAACRRDPMMLAELADLLACADAAVAEKSPPCRACGRCCRFDEFGHRLYVSTGELALLTTRPAPHPPHPGLCPYQDGSVCTARAGRALGCRVFFCDGALADWSNALYERFHAEIRRLHERHGVEYLYVDLTAGLLY